MASNFGASAVYSDFATSEGGRKRVPYQSCYDEKMELDESVSPGIFEITVKEFHRKIYVMIYKKSKSGRYAKEKTWRLTMTEAEAMDVLSFAPQIIKMIDEGNRKINEKFPKQKFLTSFDVVKSQNGSSGTSGIKRIPVSKHSQEMMNTAADLKSEFESFLAEKRNAAQVVSDSPAEKKLHLQQSPVYSDEEEVEMQEAAATEENEECNCH